MNLRTKGSSSETGNVFIADGSEEISVYWASSEELVVVATGRIFKHEETFEGTRITVKK